MERETLKSRLGFILLSAGCAIGIGNVWKFPYMAGQGGGGAFVLFYLLFLVILGLPIMTMEFAAGAAHGQLHGHNRDAHDDQADEIKQHKVSTAVLAGDIGETPDIADADGAAGTDQQEP